MRFLLWVFAFLGVWGFPRALECDDSNFKRTVRATSKVLFVEFYSPNCRFCRDVDPIVHKLARVFNHDDSKVQVVRIDMKANKKTRKEYDIIGYPTLQLLGPEGTLIASYAKGARNLDAMAKWITRHTGAQPQWPEKRVVHLDDNLFDDVVGSGRPVTVAFVALWVPEWPSPLHFYADFARREHDRGSEHVFAIVDTSSDKTGEVVKRFRVNTAESALHFPSSYQGSDPESVFFTVGGQHLTPDDIELVTRGKLLSPTSLAEMRQEEDVPDLVEDTGSEDEEDYYQYVDL